MNKETIDAMNEAREGGLTSFSSVEELMDDLEDEETLVHCCIEE